jgi:hypothetical protein
MDAFIQREGLRDGCDGDSGDVWGEWVVVGQDGEDASACGAQKFNAFEDTDAWGRRGARGDAGGDSG